MLRRGVRLGGCLAETREARTRGWFRTRRFSPQSLLKARNSSKRWVEGGGGGRRTPNYKREHDDRAVYAPERILIRSQSPASWAISGASKCTSRGDLWSATWGNIQWRDERHVWNKVLVHDGHALRVGTARACYARAEESSMAGRGVCAPG